MIYLASTSPRRRELLRKIKIAFQIVQTRYRERPDLTASPSKLAVRHALGKAENAVVPGNEGCVLGVDTLIYFRKRILGKPKTVEHAYRMLKSFSGRSHYVYSAIAFVDLKTGRKLVNWDKTRVTFNRLSTATIRRYLSRVNPLDKAGGYAIQHGKELIHTIRGSYTNVMGLPVELLNWSFANFFLPPCGGGKVGGQKAVFSLKPPIQLPPQGGKSPKGRRYKSNLKSPVLKKDLGHFKNLVGHVG